MSRGPTLILALVFFIEAALYSVLTPLLPGLVERLDLSKGAAGVLVSMYLVGAVAGALLGGSIVRAFGHRRTTQFALLTIAACGVGFALSGSFAFAVLFRTAGGIGGGVAWLAAMTWLMSTGPRSHRGERLGTAMSLGLVGTLAGPLIGNGALVIGLLPAFILIALVCLACAVTLPMTTLGAEPVQERSELIKRSRSDRRLFASSVWTLALTAFLIGAVLVLFPLELSAMGLDDVWIGWVFACASGLSATVTYLAGRAVGRVGAYVLTSASLVATAAVLLVHTIETPLGVQVVLVMVTIGIATGLGFSPNAATITFDADRLSLRGTTTSLVLLLGFSGGEAIGGIVAPAVAQRTSDDAVLTMLSVVVALTLVIVWAADRARRGNKLRGLS